MNAEIYVRYKHFSNTVLVFIVFCYIICLHTNVYKNNYKFNLNIIRDGLSRDAS